ncbi:hypothetical protein NDU88_003770 [Pleurodeles waltl]|uniref:Uncharacterized protein n=1 Tax=Pleurodeles waltl TaxID=8319 RepID=A0AAV7QE59_PLEWA|nr:hypothetical protein NDU88_003770 [Pleurodeles waltl]
MEDRCARSPGSLLQGLRVLTCGLLVPVSPAASGAVRDKGREVQLPLETKDTRAGRQLTEKTTCAQVKRSADGAKQA